MVTRHYWSMERPFARGESLHREGGFFEAFLPNRRSVVAGKAQRSIGRPQHASNSLDEHCEKTPPPLTYLLRFFWRTTE